MISFAALLSAASVFISLAAPSWAYSTPKLDGLTVLQSKLHPGVNISYKESGICETTPGVRSYSGYVHLPPYVSIDLDESQDYPLDTFFWFFESRHDPANAPLVIVLNGGPGASSMEMVFTEMGPCLLNEGSKTTRLNFWSWSREANLLFIDQPNMVGFSYEKPTNNDDEITTMIHYGNSTDHAAAALWHFAQAWFTEFPKYKPNDEKISIMTVSYGGHFGPAFMSYFARQNEKIADLSINTAEAHYLHVDTLGIMNGCIDELLDSAARMAFAANNTYGLQIASEKTLQNVSREWSRPEGVEWSLKRCRSAEKSIDSTNATQVAWRDHVCSNATKRAYSKIESALIAKTWVTASNVLQPFYYVDPDASSPATFLNQPWVMKALGVTMGYWGVTDDVFQAFVDSGDHAKGRMLADLGYLLNHGVKVHLVYGDADFKCPWQGGEAASRDVSWRHQEDFEDSGYQMFYLNNTKKDIKGMTRQAGDFSFTRVFEAGHVFFDHDPELGYRWFERAQFGRDVATGTVHLNNSELYVTHGFNDTLWWREQAPWNIRATVGQ